MGSAYTPGLKVTRHALIERTRRLPIKGEILVGKGDRVPATDVVARAELPGDIETVRINQDLGVEPVEVRNHLLVEIGDSVEKGQVLAEMKAFFGLFKSSSRAPCTGKAEFLSEVTGHMGIRKPPVPIDVRAYIDGVVAEVIAGEGVVIRSHGAIVQGIFGIGGEQRGTIEVRASSPEDELRPDDLDGDVKGKVIVGGALARVDTFRKAAALGAAGLVTGGIIDRDMHAYLGYHIGVAVTGHEDIPFTLIVTEGFGRMSMSQRTFDLLKGLEGRIASINGATQIRAGAMRPEIIVADEAGETATRDAVTDSIELALGTTVRVIRVPYFGLLGEVTALPQEPVVIDTGAMVRVLNARLADGREVTVPRANVEIIRT